MVKLILLGGGKIGSAITAMLGSTGDYQLTVADRDAKSLERLPTKHTRTMVLDVADPEALRKAMKGHDVVISAMPYHLTPVIAGAAKDWAADKAGDAKDWLLDKAANAGKALHNAADRDGDGKLGFSDIVAGMGQAKDWASDKASAAGKAIGNAAGAAKDWIGDKASAAGKALHNAVDSLLIVSEPFSAPNFEARPVFEEELVVVTSRTVGGLSKPATVGSATLIAFSHGCSYRKRVEEWLATAGVVPDRVLEFASYQAIIACVAAGTGFAVVPRSVLADLRSAKGIRQHELPRRFALSRTHLMWNGEVSPALNGLISILSHKC